ncbi:MAG: hypothetical protein L3J37_12045 [Rhodobacteraceae bacterium]|nr:hypothetical protein [Paracoccaceae bacterium]
MANAGADTPKLDGSIFMLSIDDAEHAFVLQDVNGMLDINAASRSLLATFLRGIERENLLETIISTRNSTPFRDTETFITLLNLPASTTVEAAKLVTIHSGRRRINGETAPIALLEILSGETGPRAQLLAAVDRRLLRTRTVTKVVVFRMPK